MTEHEVARTLVKSAPELWEVCSDPDSLGRHLEAFGEIRITRVEPESTVAWEGERASGTVRIEPSGWGTRVILTATSLAVTVPEEAEPEPQVMPEPEPVAQPAPVVVAETEVAETEVEADPAKEPPPPRRGFFRRLGAVLFKNLVTPIEVPDEAFGAAQEAEPEPVQPDPEAVQPDPEPVQPAAEAVEPDPKPVDELDPAVVLQAMLNRLGSDHHRPFSRG